ncbi:LytTR family DNA-binding domain-containing protein [Aliisedimentitalea sp. MJ-SS2]|uniref:LytTR family DNA-binding domain-containing protein n=1 Tax=Aliisedimentitalea sp. MJ-SS2 TaxID=3049795 RepID=UPI00345FFF52
MLYLKSVEHYVDVVLHDTSELVWASLRNLIEMLHPDLGVQSHRSYWVTAEAVVGMNRQKSAQFLALSDGHEVPVSRQRRVVVKEWVQWQVLNNPGKKDPGKNPGQVQQGGACDNPHMQRDRKTIFPLSGYNFDLAQIRRVFLTGCVTVAFMP